MYVFENIHLRFKEIDQTLCYCQVAFLQAPDANFHQSPYMSNDCLARELRPLWHLVYFTW